MSGTTSEDLIPEALLTLPSYPSSDRWVVNSFRNFLMIEISCHLLRNESVDAAARVAIN